MIILRSPSFKIETLAISPDGAWLFAPRRGHCLRSRDIGILRWTISEGDTPTLLPFARDVGTIQFTQDRKSMVLDGWSVYIRDMMTGDQVETAFPSEDYAEDYIKVSLTQDGLGFLATLTNYVTYPSSRVVFRNLSHLDANVWSVDVRRSFESAALYLPGGMQFVTIEYETGKGGTDPGSVFVTRDSQTGQPVSETCYPGGGSTGVVQSPDFRYFAGRFEKSITVFRTQDTRAPVAVIKNNSRKDFTGVAFHPSGCYLAVTSNDATVKVYDTTTWNLAKTYTWTIGPLRSVAFSQDGLLAAAGGIGKIVVWDWDV